SRAKALRIPERRAMVGIDLTASARTGSRAKAHPAHPVRRAKARVEPRRALINPSGAANPTTEKRAAAVKPGGITTPTASAETRALRGKTSRRETAVIPPQVNLGES